MTDVFRGVVPFVAVAEARSFRQAAVQLGVSTAAVSKAVQVLERELGVLLVNRAGRQVSLTREGQAFYERAREALAAVRSARDAVEPAGKRPEGPLLVSVPLVTTGLVARALTVLKARYPGLSPRVQVTDRLSRLEEESIDLAVRVGQLSDSSLVARRLRKTTLVTVASPAYLARAGTPKKLEDLVKHDCLSLVGPRGKPWPWSFKNGPLEVRSALQADHGPMLLELVEAGFGVGQAFDFMIERPLAEGRVVQVLTSDVGPGPDVYAVCAPGRRASARVKAAFEVFGDAFAA